MSYEVPTGDLDFRLTGAPYTVSSSAIAYFSFDGRPLVYFAPPPGVIRPYKSQWQGALSRQQGFSAGYSTSRPVSTTRRQSSQQAKPLEATPFGLFWGAVAKKEVKVSFSHGQSQKKESTASDRWQQSERKDSGKKSAWDKSIKSQDQGQSSPWNLPPERDSSVSEGMQSVDLYGSRKWQSPAYIHPQQPLNFTFRDREYQPQTNGSVFFQIGAFEKEVIAVPVDSKRRFTFQSNRAEDQPVILPWGFGQKARDETVTGNYGGEIDPEVIEKPEPEQPEIRESYLLMNIITAVVLPARTPLELPSMEISLDIDSFSWSFTGQLWGASNIALVEPDENGPKQIEVDINGWKWIFIIERYSTDRRFGDERYTLYGSSRTQLLAAPYAPQRSKSNSANLNAKQAIIEELANTGFTATYPDLNDYSTPDWIMPGGSFSYQNQTAMQVVAKVATTAGSVIIPSRDNDQVSIQPRYPASPWHWNTATMDKIIPASMVISLSANWRPEQAYNAVYVSGTNAGVAVNVKRTGSNGDNPAPDILEDWLTETQVNTERGRNELAKGGNQSITTIELPLTDTNTAPGLIEPGMLVEVQDITGDWQALCLATSISASGVGTVIQSVDLERHY
ncbi:hypothetical protein [Endozoicomonas sp. SCSIO W0465]|uniref:hypothetical protein n=2 Tax=Endozoicomonas sp. SCSIO W0465 TaxID=2918516 RepID=UPI002074C571|nr:hypothetical protein [Endozoicomonas sp. SCSIO W0465]USE38688.1 hypothetical protein MJO57_11250 [Endozoicomonas sp. SCSIO W0465]